MVWGRLRADSGRLSGGIYGGGQVISQELLAVENTAFKEIRYQ